MATETVRGVFLKSLSQLSKSIMFQVTDSLSSVLQVAVLVLGAGPTGLGTATRLQQHGFDDWLLVDKVG
jgi:ribulose 1,5-bisphosphate synthetase/thiazole synthase